MYLKGELALLGLTPFLSTSPPLTYPIVIYVQPFHDIFSV